MAELFSLKLVPVGLFASRNEWMFLLGLSLLVVILLRRSWRYWKRSSGSGEQADRSQQYEGQKAARKARQVPDELLQWQVEMHELARDLKAELDTKIVIVQSLVRQVREESERLEKLLDQPRASSRPLVSARGREALERIQEAVDPASETVHRQIGHLADLGHPVEEIARQTGRSRGDVEWILSLRTSRD